MSQISISYNQEKEKRGVKKKQVVFVDLFCGIGAFHEAIIRLFPDADCR